jgi:GxxExxY protein
MNKDPFTHRVIGLAMETHRAVGPGLGEELYHQAFVNRLIASGIDHLSKPRRELLYRGFVADVFEADVVFSDRLIAELKALRSGFSSSHFTQLLSYNKFWRVRTGMLIDFGKPSLVSKRVVYTSKTGEFPKNNIPGFVTSPDLAKDLIAIADRCLREIGLGYRESTWVGLMTAALRAEGIPFVANPIVELPGLGTSSLKCFVIDGTVAISITALGQAVTAMDRAALQTALRWLGLPWGISFHYGKDTADVMLVSAPVRSKSTFQVHPICGFPESAGNSALSKTLTS